MTYDPRCLEFEARRWALGSEGLSLDYPGVLNEPYAPVWRQAWRLSVVSNEVVKDLRRMWGNDLRSLR